MYLFLQSFKCSRFLKLAFLKILAGYRHQPILNVTVSVLLSGGAVYLFNLKNTIKLKSHLRGLVQVGSSYNNKKKKDISPAGVT